MTMTVPEIDAGIVGEFFYLYQLQTVMAGKNYLDGVVQQGKRQLNVAYQNIIPILTKAIQEQQEQIEQLKAEVAALKGA